MKKFVLSLSIGLTLSACNTSDLEFDNIEVQPINGVYGVPLGEISYTLRDLLDEANIEDEQLEEDSNSLLSLTYVDQINYANQNEFIQIDDVSGDGFYNNPNSAVGPGAGTRDVSIPFRDYTTHYDPQDGEELDSVFYNGGQINATITSNANVSNVLFVLVFQNTLDVADRDPVTLSGNLGRPAMGQVSTVTAAQNLANHVTVLNNETNELTVSFAATFTLEPTDVLDGTETLTFEFTYGNQTFSIIYGKFGQNTVQVGNETLAFDFFEDLGEGIFFDAPILRFNFENSFGIPIALDFSGLSVDDGAGGNQTFLSGSITDPRSFPEILSAPDLNSSTTSTIEITSSNSNIRNLFATSPSRILFDVSGTSNYYDQENQEINFIEPDHSIDASIELEIPFAVRLEDFQESFRFNLSEGLNIKNVDSAFLRIVTLNELPFSGTLVMEIQDENEEVIYTVPESVVVNTPFINIDGLVTDPSGASVDVPLSPEALDALATGGFINMILTLNTPPTQTSNDIYVQVLADYSIDISVGLGGLVNIKI